MYESAQDEDGVTRLCDLVHIHAFDGDAKLDPQLDVAFPIRVVILTG